MERISWSEFKAKKLSDILQEPCVLVTGDGDPAFYVVVKPEGAMIARIEGIISLINASRGFG